MTNKSVFYFLPNDEDPDSIVQKEGPEAFTQRLDKAIPLSIYLIEHIKAQVDISSIDGLSHFVELAKPLLAQIKAKTFSLLLKTELAKIAGTSSEQLFGDNPQFSAPPVETRPSNNHYNNPSQVSFKNHTKKSQAKGLAPQRQLKITINRMIIGALLARPSLAMTVNNKELNLIKILDNKSITFIIELINLLQANSHLNTAALLDRYRGTLYETSLMKLAGMEFLTNDEGNDSIAEEFQDAFTKLVKRATKQLHQQLCLKPRGQLTEPELTFLKSFQG